MVFGVLCVLLNHTGRSADALKVCRAQRSDRIEKNVEKEPFALRGASSEINFLPLTLSKG